MIEVFLVLKDQQIGIHALFDNLAVLAFEQVRGWEYDHIVLGGGKLRNHLKDVVWKRWALPKLLVHHLYLLYRIFYFIFILVKMLSLDVYTSRRRL